VTLVIAVQKSNDNEIKKEPIATETTMMKSPPTSRPISIMTTPIAVSMPAKTQMPEVLGDSTLRLRNRFLTLRVIIKAKTKPISKPTALGHSTVKINTIAKIATQNPNHRTKWPSLRAVGRSKSSLMAGIV
jgi:hypothetical protein